MDGFFSGGDGNNGFDPLLPPPIFQAPWSCVAPSRRVRLTGVSADRSFARAPKPFRNMFIRYRALLTKQAHFFHFYSATLYPPCSSRTMFRHRSCSGREASARKQEGSFQDDRGLDRSDRKSQLALTFSCLPFRKPRALRNDLVVAEPPTDTD